MVAGHNILWRREPYPHHLAPSSARDDERLSGDDGAGVDPVADRDRVDHGAGIGPSRRALGDGPDRVPRTHDVDLLPAPGGEHPRCSPAAA